MERIKLYFDCDTGIDDAIALGYLLAEKEKVELVGIGSVCGNIDAETGARNSINLLKLAGVQQVPVAKGDDNYLRTKFQSISQHIHGDNGIGNIQLEPAMQGVVTYTASEMLVALARKYPGELHVLATGPLTNLARALQLEPELPRLIKQITIMGGAANAPGNRTPVAEANIAGDPEAAAMVFSSLNNILLVPLDVTMNHALDERHRQQLLRSDRPFAQALGQMLELYISFYEGEYGRKACAIHDPAAAYFAVEGVRQCLAPRINVVIDDTSGPGRGQTICDMRGQYSGYPVQEGANCTVVLCTDTDLATVLVDKLLTL
ncbi:nucleoside hydrolase [Klebsiella pneumoniae]|uniref:nucleoside hydrolase n=1 Tax=Klebsiella TaxID=570 RepID=UPI001EEC6008|nr:MULTISPECIES: nucleoside hydrolase [Klebsiella]EKU9431087.1 nucleoside hydrolase [Klebsiella variicola]MBZ6673842.1 nucleoside hydrolase [Klebsiella pneumoniae]MBZ7249228.1 nucleoside hydrolase [Klebsiella pneumoniae]UXO81835.1 nucleoside hydrolase [Klebsiella michiganensis]